MTALRVIMPFRHVLRGLRPVSDGYGGVFVNALHKTKCTPWAMGCILFCIHDVIDLLTSTKWYIIGLWDIVPII